MSSSGFPDATNTGVPASTTLTPAAGMTIRTAGAVVSGLNITGMVTISASNVTLENCKISADAYASIVVQAGATGVTIRNCEIYGGEINGQNNEGSLGIAIFGGGVTVLNCNIYGSANGVSINSLKYGPVLIQDNYIHDITASGTTNHYNGIQYNGNSGGSYPLDIEHNTIINPHNQADAVMIDNWNGPVNGVTVNNNLLIGGGYNLYSDHQFNSSPITNVAFTNNHLGGGLYGDLYPGSIVAVYTGNVDDGMALLQTLNTNPLPVSDSDLIVSELTIPVSVVQGETFDFTYAIKNQGAASGTSAAAYFVDQKPDTAHFLGYGSTNPLATGAQQNFSGGFGTADLSVGQHTLWVDADNWGQVAESNETNNFRSITFNVTAPADATSGVTGDGNDLLSGGPEIDWAGQAFRLYEVTLGRGPDVGGFDYWVGNLRDGMPLQTAAGYFIGSPEFQANIGSPNDTQFVTLLYNNALHRAPDPGGLAYWMTALGNGMTRDDLTLVFSESEEAKATNKPLLEAFVQAQDPGQANVLVGGPGSDTASYASALTGVTVSLAKSGPQETFGAGVDWLQNIENLTGSSFNDTLTGDAQSQHDRGRGGQ